MRTRCLDVVAVGGLVIAAAMATGCPPEKQGPSDTCVPSRSELAERLCPQDLAQEPNGTLVMATTGSGCPSASVPATVAGNIGTAGDVDVFRTGYCDGDGGDKKVLSATIDADLRLCLMVRCALGKTIVFGRYKVTPGDTAPDAGAPEPHIIQSENPVDASPMGGFRGACRSGRGSIAVQFQCPVRDTRAEGYLWIDADKKSPGTCAPYAVSYDLR